MPAFRLCVGVSCVQSRVEGDIGLLGERDLTAASLTTPGKFVIIGRADGDERARGDC